MKILNLFRKRLIPNPYRKICDPLLIKSTIDFVIRNKKDFINLNKKEEVKKNASKKFQQPKEYLDRNHKLRGRINNTHATNKR